MRHKQILDVAADNPEASVEDLAAKVPSATAELVERVLEEYGDPASEDESPESEESPEPEEPTMGDETPESDQTVSQPATGEQAYPDPSDLSAAERETIRAINEHPTASQRDLADELGVTASTVSNRVNGIDGFDWANREQFAKAVLGERDTDSPETSPATSEMSEVAAAFQSTVDELATQISDLEGRMETIADGSGATHAQVFQDPELVHKVVHACMSSENITEEEELRILESLL